MKKIKWLFAAAVPLLFALSCQKQIASEDSIQESFRNPTIRTAENCGTCVSTWPSTLETIAFSGGAGSTLEVEQDGSSLKKLVLTNNGGFTQLNYKVTYYKANGTDPKVLLSHNDGSAAGGKIYTRNLFLTKEGSTSLNVLDNVFPNCWDKCDKVVVEILEMGGAGNPPVQTATYYLRKLCAPAITISANPNPAKVGEPVTVTANIPVDCGTLTLQKWNGSGWDAVSNGYTFTPTEPSTTAECLYKFRAVYTKACGCDYDNATSSEFCLEVLPACTNSLTSNFACGSGTVTFSFTATEAGPIVIQGGLSAGAVITSSSSNVLTLNPTHSSAGGPSSVTRWEGNVEACTTVTVTINYTGGNGIGAWSAKRGEVVLGSTLAQSCN